MDRELRTRTFLNRLLSRWGGSYVLRMQSFTQLISFVLAVFGIYYILIEAELSRIQIIELFVSVFAFVTLVNLLVPIYTAMATTNARARLDMLYKNRAFPSSTPTEEQEILAWQEINALPWRYAIVELATAYVLVVLPAVLFMRWIGGVNAIQAAHIAVGGLISATLVVVQNILSLERILGPVWVALLPRDYEHQASHRGIRLQTRLQAVITVLILSAILFLGMDKFLSKQIETYLLAAAMIVLGLYLARLLTQTATTPINEIVRAMEKFRKGDHSARASILSADETSLLAMQLNQLLDQLQASQHHLEKQVEQRTADLNTKTGRLQAAAQVSREAASAQNVNTLLDQTVNLITEHFGFYHTGIFLIDAAGEYAVLRASSSEGGKRMLERGHRLEVGQQGIVGAAAYQNRPHVAMDVGQEAVFFYNPDLPFTRAEAAIPLTARGKVVGVLDVQSTEPTAFAQDDTELLQTLADQIALTIQNAQLIEESQATLVELESALSESVKQSWRSKIGGQKRAYRYSPTGLTAIKKDNKGRAAEASSADSDAAKINIPVTLRGQRIGNISLTRKGDTPWDDADQSLALEVANQVGLALENSRLLTDAQQRAFQEQQVNIISSQIQRSTDLETILQNTVRELGRTLGVPNAFIQVGLTPPDNSNEEQR